MARSTRKGPFFHPSLLKQTKNKKDFQRIKVWARSSTILKEFIGIDFDIHNGRSFIPITIKEEMVGHKFGEFASTRKIGGHKLKKTKAFK